MSKHRSRQGKGGKIVTAGHSTRVEGLDKLLKQLQNWDEITTIRLGAIQVRNKIGRSSKKLVAKSPGEIETKQARKRAQGGGGFSFHATRWAVNGTGMTTGIRCIATYGRTSQEVVLTSQDYPKLITKLVAAGFVGNKAEQELKSSIQPSP